MSDSARKTRTTAQPSLTVGDPVVFTLGPLGLMQTPWSTTFVQPYVSEGDTGTYAGPHPNPLMAAEDWHVITVGEFVCVCHTAMFRTGS